MNVYEKGGEVGMTGLREKVIKGLKHCATMQQCSSCVYDKECAANGSVNHAMIDAIELLKAKKDTVPLVRGRWIQKETSGGFDIQCSVCEMWFYFPWPISSVKFTGHNFCPHCGARMDLEEPT